MFSRTLSPTTRRALSFRPRASPYLYPAFTLSHFSTNTRVASSKDKDYLDRNNINTESSEYAKSSTDGEVAENSDAAFDPSKTRPEQEKDTAGEGNKVNPLEVSPGNPEVSKTRGGTEDGAQNAESRGKSGAGSAPKNKKV